MFTQFKPKLIANLIFLGTLTFAIPVSAQETSVSMDAARKINSANELVRQGEFDKAIEEYQQVTSNNADRDELNYNQAVAQFRKGDIQSAQAMFGEAATSSDTSIAASSRYNFGNCVCSTAIKTAEQDKPAAIEQLREAISHYRDSLRLNNDNADARANIELAAEMIRKLQEEQKQEEQQKQDQQDQNQQSQDQQSKDQQSKDQQPQDSQSQQDQERNQSGESKSDQQDSDQQSGSEQSDSEQSKDEQNQPQSKAEQSEENESDSDNSEQNAEQNDSQESESKDGEPQTDDEQVVEEENDNNPIPAGQITAAGEQDENEKPNGSVAMADPNAKDGLMTKQEAMKMLQSVRDRDMLRRLRQQQLERSRHIPVDKDW